MLRALNIAYLYPAQMNIYGDRGNVICLRERCLRRGISVEIHAVGLGEISGGGDWDIMLIGGGQDREQALVAHDLQGSKGRMIADAIEDGAVALAICGGYQLFGEYYRPAVGDDLPGLGVFDARTIHPGPDVPRCIGNVVTAWRGGTLVGFENHGGRTYLGPDVVPLARVLQGFGNNAEDGWEGAIYKNAFGTYLHGSLLPKNPRFADHLISLALERRFGDGRLEPLDDSLEEQAHQAAIAVARGSRSFLRRVLGSGSHF